MTLSLQILEAPNDESSIAREYHMHDREIIIGREFDCNLCLPDGTAQISRHHAKIVKASDEKKFTVIDTSSNGTLVNGNKISKAVEFKLRDGDLLNIGRYKILVSLIEKPDEIINGSNDETNREKSHFRVASKNAVDDLLVAGYSDVEVKAIKPKGFSRKVRDLTPDLMYDPFEEEGNLKRTNVDEEDVFDVDGSLGGNVPQSATDVSETSHNPRNHLITNVQNKSELDPELSRKLFNEIIPVAFEKFLVELDPEKLEREYDDFIFGWRNRNKRYWAIHKKQFKKKKEDGTLLRLFRAYLTEQMAR